METFDLDWILWGKKKSTPNPTDIAATNGDGGNEDCEDPSDDTSGSPERHQMPSRNRIMNMNNEEHFPNAPNGNPEENNDDENHWTKEDVVTLLTLHKLECVADLIERDTESSNITENKSTNPRVHPNVSDMNEKKEEREEKRREEKEIIRLKEDEEDVDIEHTTAHKNLNMGEENHEKKNQLNDENRQNTTYELENARKGIMEDEKDKE